jgi:hypothetical protein
MRNVFLICILNIIITTSVFSQDVTCDELTSYVKTEGYRKGSVYSYQLYESSWLKSVECYQYDNVLFVIAEIKKDQYSYTTNKYIFCGIPKANWDSFYWGYNDSGKTYGERFHKYIIDYTCNCN